MKRYLWRFKSNTETIVHRISDGLVSIVWSKSFSFGGNCSFCYKYDPENLIPLTDAEVEGILHLRDQRGLNNLNLGLIIP